MRIRRYDSSLWREGNSHISTARVPVLVVQASRFTFVLKYRLHMVTEWNTLFSNIIRCLHCLSTKVWATSWDIKQAYFPSKASYLFHLLSKQGSFKNKGGYRQYSRSLCTTEDLQHKPSAAISMLSPTDYSSQVNHQALWVCRRTQLRCAPPRAA